MQPLAAEADPRTGAAPIIVRGRWGAILSERPGVAVVSFGGRQAILTDLSRGQRDALTRLLGDGDTEDALADLLANESTARLAEWYCRLGALSGIGAVEWVVQDGEEELARLIPLTEGFRPEFERFDPDRPHSLSSYAFLRRDGSHWCVESPLAHARVELLGRAATVLVPLLGEGTPNEMARQTGLPPELAASVLALLGAAGMLAPAAPDGGCSADAAAHAAGWAFHDALFHFRSRRGRHDAPYGVRPDAAPVVTLPRERPYHAANRVELSRPDPAWIATVDPPFSDVLERRRSARHYDARPIEAEQLGELLFRVAADRTTAGDDGPGAVRRTYPSGGGCYPLELYAVVCRCRGLAPGVYRYDPAAHALDRIPTTAQALDELVAGYRSKAASDEIQVLLLVTLVPVRVNRRYGSIGYSLALKEVGALFQSTYLVATAMGLAPCAVGGGDGEAGARVLGLDPLHECVVGEFMVGSGPAGGD